MGWVTLSLRKQALKQEQAHYQLRLLEISREKRQMARRKSFETNSILTEQRRAERDLKSRVYDSAKAEKKAKLAQLDQAYEAYKINAKAQEAYNKLGITATSPNYGKYQEYVNWRNCNPASTTYNDFVRSQYDKKQTTDYQNAVLAAYTAPNQPGHNVTPAPTFNDAIANTTWLNDPANKHYGTQETWEENDFNVYKTGFAQPAPAGLGGLTEAQIEEFENTATSLASADTNIKSFSEWEKEINNLGFTRDSITEDFEDASLQYQDEKNDLKTDYEFELQLAEEEAADEELILDQEQTEIEAPLEAISQEIESVGSAVSSAIQSSTIKLA